MFYKRITNALLILSVVILLFGSGYKLGQYNATNEKSGGTPSNVVGTTAQGSASSVNFNIFWDVWNQVQTKYVDRTKVDPQKMLYGAVKGMVASINDPYTFFLTPDENKATKADLGGLFEGIGAELGLQDNRIVIVAPLKDSPAQKVGILSGDIIEKVDGQDTKGWTLTQAVSKIRGTKGTKVSLTVVRNSKELTFNLVRDAIHISSVEYRKEASLNCKNCAQVGYIKVIQFGDNTNSEWDQAVTQIAKWYQSGEIKGLVLDLRDNPGGYLESAVYLASDFLPQGKVVVKQESTTTESQTYTVDREGRLLTIPVTVLINKGSASASEILSGALRDYNRAKLVGEKSFGKGSVQEALDLSGGAGLHVTVAKWILPNGDWINGKGIQPAIPVQNTIKDGNTLSRQNDAQLEKAVVLLVQ